MFEILLPLLVQIDSSLAKIHSRNFVVQVQSGNDANEMMVMFPLLQLKIVMIAKVQIVILIELMTLVLIAMYCFQRFQ